MRLKELTGDITELSNWINEYAETLPEEDRIKMADAGEYLRMIGAEDGLERVKPNPWMRSTEMFLIYRSPLLPSILNCCITEV